MDAPFELHDFQLKWEAKGSGESILVLCKKNSALNVTEKDRAEIRSSPTYQNISSSTSREDFLNGRVLLRHGIMALTGKNFPFLERRRTNRAPEWPKLGMSHSGLHTLTGSLSHTASSTSVVVATYRDEEHFFGIDLEQKLKPESYEALKTRILRSHPDWPDTSQQGILDAFSIYESVYKAISQAGLPEPTPKDLKVRADFKSAYKRSYRVQYLEGCQIRIHVLEGSETQLTLAELTLSPCNFYIDFLR